MSTAKQNICTMSRCKKDGELYGPLHASSDGDKTFCGQSADSGWWIVTNKSNSIFTCKRCIKISNNQS